MNQALSPAKSVNAYADVYEQLAADASFLWLLRSMAVNHPHYSAGDVCELEQRIEAQLNGLLVSPEQAWDVCSEIMDLEDAGDVFVTAILAFHSLDPKKIQYAVDAGLANEQALPGLISALGWLPGKLCHSWIKQFFSSKNFDHKYLAMAACSVRRDDPLNYLTVILQREDCVAHDRLYARALRLIGELKRHDLLPALHTARASENPRSVFWANWSATLLGDQSAIANLKPFVLEPGPHQFNAIALAFRALPIKEAREWINDLARSPDAIRCVIKATATLGDPHAVAWLIGQMQAPELARLAGEAFTFITGMDLDENNLALDEPPNLDAFQPNDDPADDNVDMDEDENLPFPDVDKVISAWQKHQHQFTLGQRYFMGKVIEEGSLEQVFSTGHQRQRCAAALELALLQPNNLLLNYAGKGPGV